MPTHRTPILGVMFDLDDTLNDRAASWMAFVRLLAGPMGHLSNCDLLSVHAAILLADQGGYRPKEELFHDLQKNLPWRSSVTSEAVERLWRLHFPTCTIVREGVHSVLTDLKSRGLRTAIVTNGRTDAQRAKIDQMGIGLLVDAVVTSEAVGSKKPDAGIFHTALHAINLTAAEVMFVGDNPRLDVSGPAALGIRTTWFANGRDWAADCAEPDYRINTFSELIAVLAPADKGRSPKAQQR